MQIIPHLPAPTAIHDPLYGHAARAARTAALRVGAQEPVDAYGGNRLRRDLSRSEISEPVDRRPENAAVPHPLGGPAADTVEYGAGSLFFAQQFAQEDVPENGAGVIHERGVAAYPSLDFDGDIFLPGQAVPLGWTGGPRLDILV